MTPEEQWKEELKKNFFDENTVAKHGIYQINRIGTQMALYDFISSLLSSQKETLMRKAKLIVSNEIAIQERAAGVGRRNWFKIMDDILQKLNEIE